MTSAPSQGDDTASAALRRLPSINVLLDHAAVTPILRTYGRRLAVFAARAVLETTRSELKQGAVSPDHDELARRAADLAQRIAEPTLKPVLNATGVILHTNLGRAPLGGQAAEDIARIARGYSNLEFDLDTGKRGQRSTHVRDILRFLTEAEDLVIVNNNAAGIVLTLSTLAAGRRALISRGELIEIGGAFRIPDIMAASGARMTEVGTTNRTRMSDYEAAITSDTALIFKAHQSNYAIRGFTECVPVRDLAALAHAHGLPLVYDIGSGLIRPLRGLPGAREPDVRQALADGADLVAFSCDKLMGGPQAGIVAGRGDLVQRLARAPLMRAFRVGKVTLAGLFSVCRRHLDDETPASLPAVSMLHREPGAIEQTAHELEQTLRQRGVASRVVKSQGQCGGGGLPDFTIESRAVELLPPEAVQRDKHRFGDTVYKRLLLGSPPVVGVLREGRLLLDVLALQDGDVKALAHAVATAARGKERP